MSNNTLTLPTEEKTVEKKVRLQIEYGTFIPQDESLDYRGDDGVKLDFEFPNIKVGI